MGRGLGIYCQAWFGSNGKAGAASGPSGACPGQLAGGAASRLRIEDSKTDSGSDSEVEPLADQDPPEQDSASDSELEASQLADPGEHIVIYCEML